MIVAEADREDEARERDDRREREVDLAGTDDEGEPDRQQDQRRQGGGEGRVDVGREEDARRQVHEQEQQADEHADDRQALDPAETGWCSWWQQDQAVCCNSMR